MKRLLFMLVMLPALCSASSDELQKIEMDHGLSLAISGMVIVFGGLAAISVCISLLPKILKLTEKRERPMPLPQMSATAGGVGLDPGTLSAIAFVLHAEAERTAGLNLKVTLDLHPSPWALSSQMRVLPGRIKS